MTGAIDEQVADFAAKIILASWTIMAVQRFIETGSGLMFFAALGLLAMTMLEFRERKDDRRR